MYIELNMTHGGDNVGNYETYMFSFDIYLINK